MMVVAIQYFAKDRDRAMRLARWIADIEKTPRADVQIWLVNRFDCPKADEETVNHVAKKFPVTTMTTTTKGFGWPDGCNAMAFDVLRMMGEGVEDDHLGKHDGVLLIEPDCVVIHHDWLSMLMDDWQKVASLRLVMGAWRDSGPACGHINGNAIFSADIIRQIPGMDDAMKSIRGTAWDAALAPYFEPRWAYTGLISNRWNENTLSDEQIETPWIGVIPPVLVHGCKSMDVENYARRKLRIAGNPLISGSPHAPDSNPG